MSVPCLAVFVEALWRLWDWDFTPGGEKLKAGGEMVGTRGKLELAGGNAAGDSVRRKVGDTRRGLQSRRSGAHAVLQPALSS